MLLSSKMVELSYTDSSIASGTLENPLEAQNNHKSKNATKFRAMRSTRGSQRNITQARTHHAPTPTQTTTPPTKHTHTHTKMTQIHANCLNFVRISYEIRNNHIHGTY